MRVAVVIMCGGAGTRFWPASTQRNPKQFLTIFKDQPLVMDAYNRATRVTSPENVYMLTTRHLETRIKEVFPQMREDNIIYEPAIRSTAPCLGLGALFLKNLDPDTVMVVLPADHVVPDHVAFKKTIDLGIEFVREHHGLLTIGIVPTFPETGFGYIRVEERVASAKTVLKVKEFKEKPSVRTATRYVETGHYFWNGGMFIWKVRDFLEDLKSYSRKSYDEIIALEKPLRSGDLPAIERIYAKLTTDSIDYALMERAPDVYVVPADFKWSDVGSWLALDEFGDEFDSARGSAGRVISIDSEGNIVYAPDKLIATMGIRDTIIVDTPGALMILPKKRSQGVKELLKMVREKGLKEYL